MIVFFRCVKRYCKLSFAAIFLPKGKSDIKAFGFCDIIFVLFHTAKAVYRTFYAYRIEDISLVRSTNIAEAHFLTGCASKRYFVLSNPKDWYVISRKRVCNQFAVRTVCHQGDSLVCFPLRIDYIHHCGVIKYIGVYVNIIYL